MDSKGFKSKIPKLSRGKPYTTSEWCNSDLFLKIVLVQLTSDSESHSVIECFSSTGFKDSS
jgi:hypothetical protein